MPSCTSVPAEVGCGARLKAVAFMIIITLCGLFFTRAPSGWQQTKAVTATRTADLGILQNSQHCSFNLAATVRSSPMRLHEPVGARRHISGNTAVKFVT